MVVSLQFYTSLIGFTNQLHRLIQHPRVMSSLHSASYADGGDWVRIPGFGGSLFLATFATHTMVDELLSGFPDFRLMEMTLLSDIQDDKSTHQEKAGWNTRKVISQAKWGLTLELSASICGEKFEGPVSLEFSHWGLNFVSHLALSFCQVVLPVSFPSVLHHTDEPDQNILDPCGSGSFFLVFFDFFFVFGMGRKWR